MRVYLPSTLPGLATVLRTGKTPVGPAFAVTPGLREAYASGDQEELEYAALLLAAKASLRLLAADPAAPSRRVVIAAEVSVQASQSATGAGEVELTQPVPLTEVVSAHVDDVSAEADIRAAVDSLPAADAGDDDAMFTVDGADGHELGWYATQELPDLVA
jgi:hypothetical protein